MPKVRPKIFSPEHVGDVVPRLDELRLGRTIPKPEFGFEWIPVVPDFNQSLLATLTEIRFVPGTNELLAANQSGPIMILGVEGDRLSMRGSFTVGPMHAASDCGILSMVFDPAFSQNRFLYVAHCVSAKESRIARLVYDPGNWTDGQLVETVDVVRAGEDRARDAQHNVGTIGFEGDGTMFASFGDKGVKSTSQDNHDLLGSIIRIRPDHDADGGYTIPYGNMFPYGAGGRPEIYAFGVRNAWRVVEDNVGRLWAGDVGFSQREEVNLITRPGQNLGWPIWEGACISNCSGLTDPVRAWQQGDATPFTADERKYSGSSVAWVGPPHRGEPDPYAGLLDSVVMYGDMCQGWVRVISADLTGRVVMDGEVGNFPGLSSWSQGADGHLYASSYGNCQSGYTDVTGSRIFRLVVHTPLGGSVVPGASSDT